MMTEPGRGPGPAERWRALGPGRRAVVAGVGLVVILNVTLAAVRWVTGGAGPGGEPSSSYATAPDGAAAYADLLARQGHPVQRLRTDLARARLDPRSTLVVLDPRQVDDSESAALERFVGDGGRLVVAGRQSAPPLRQLLTEGPVWSPAGVDVATPLAPAPELGAVGSIRAAGEGSWSSVGSALPVLAGREQVVAAVATVGKGKVVLVADASVFQNRFLGEADNAAFVVAATGARGRPVSFAEAAHGYGQRQGLGALPSRWRWALGGVVVATLVWMWSRGKRFGPPEETSRSLPPPRRAYVDAVAASVARARQPDAGVEPLRRAARARLAQRAGLSSGASDAELTEAARGLGGDAEEVARLLAPITRSDDLMAAGRAASWVLEKGS